MGAIRVATRVIVVRVMGTARVAHGMVGVHKEVHVVMVRAMCVGTKCPNSTTTVIVVLHPWCWGQHRGSHVISVVKQGMSSEIAHNCSLVVVVVLGVHHVEDLVVVHVVEHTCWSINWLARV